MVNIAYQTPHLAEYFLTHRRNWDEFFPSERWVFERVGASETGFGRVLDVGCAVGGLGNAITQKFPITSYTGLDINAQAIKAAARINTLSVPTQFLCADIVTCMDVADEAFDTVAALSVADWNIDTNGIITACWKKVAPGGRLLITLRLTNGLGVNDLERSFQYIVPDEGFEMPIDKSDLEKAPYVVLNTQEALRVITKQTPPPCDILLYGYWGKPSDTATTPYEKLAFAVLSVMKHSVGEVEGNTRLECHFPVTALL